MNEITTDYSKAWQDEAIPFRQYSQVVSKELAQWKRGEDVLPYRVLLECLKKLPDLYTPTLLDAGASSGYYREVFNISGFNCHYTGMDFSPAYQRLARALYPRIRFDLGDARELPYEDSSFDIVLSSAVMMHVYEYEKVIAEAARVASKYVIFHRTPVCFADTRMYTKEAYGVPVLEIIFNTAELLVLFQKYGLELINWVDLTMSVKGGYRSYVLKK